MRYLDSIIDQCSSTGKAYRALTDLYSNPTPSRFVDRLLNFLLSEIRVSGRLGYVGTDRYLDVTGSVISLEALVWFYFFLFNFFSFAFLVFVLFFKGNEFFFFK